MSEHIFQLGEWVTVAQRFERKVKYSPDGDYWRDKKEKRWEPVGCEPQRVMLIGRRVIFNGWADFTPDEGWSWMSKGKCHIAALVVPSLRRKPFLVPWGCLQEAERE